MNLIKITPDKERARSILKMISLIENRIKKEDKEEMAALIISDYYEVIKELITAILLVNGFKTLSHKDLFEYLEENYSQFTSNDFSILDSLRVLRNRISYEGFFVDLSYLTRNEFLFKEIITKLKETLISSLK